MINYKGVCSLLVFILVILFFAVLKKVYLKNMGEIESFKENNSKPEQSANKDVDSLIANNNRERAEWQKRFRDLETELNDKYTKQADVLNTILHGKQDVERMIKDSKDTITQQTNKFETNVGKLGEFHDNYQKQLENILKRKYDVQSDQFEVTKKLQQEKLKQLESQLKEFQFLERQITKTTDNKARSIRCMGNGERINIRPVESFGNPTGDYLIFLGDGNRDGCLTYSAPGRNGYGIEPCEVSNKRQHFRFHDVSNVEEYKKHLEHLDESTKNEAKVESGSFKLIHPKVYPDKCITIDPNSNALSIIPCHPSEQSKGGINQQFKTSNIHSTLKCNN